MRPKAGICMLVCSSVITDACRLLFSSTPSTMPPLVALPSYSNAFSDYRPSRNAHTDLLTNKRSGGRIVKIGLGSEFPICVL